MKDPNRALNRIRAKAKTLARGLSYEIGSYDELRERLEYEAEDFLRSLAPETLGRYIAVYGREVSLTPEAIGIILETEQNLDGVFIALCIELLIDRVWEIVQLKKQSAGVGMPDFANMMVSSSIQ